MTIKFGNFANLIVRNFVVIWEAPKKGSKEEQSENTRQLCARYDFPDFSDESEAIGLCVGDATEVLPWRPRWCLQRFGCLRPQH